MRADRRSARVSAARDADTTAIDHLADSSRNQNVGRNADIDGGAFEVCWVESQIGGHLGEARRIVGQTQVANLPRQTRVRRVQ